MPERLFTWLMIIVSVLVPFAATCGTSSASRMGGVVHAECFYQEGALCAGMGRELKHLETIDTTHILLVDDDIHLTSALRRALSYEGYRVSTTADGEKALAQIRLKPPDLVILDRMLPGIDGLEVCRRLRDAGERVAVLMLTACDTVIDRVTGLEVGADDYLAKPFATEELLARIKALLRRSTPPDVLREILHYADLELNTATRQARRGERVIELSTTEHELLALFLRNPRIVLTRALLMDRIWGIDFTGDPNVLEVYIRHLRAKLEQQGEQRLIQTIRGAGYVLR